ncbi:mechanosensitive ion channel family protein [Paludibacter sp. 221]|uniref:mechanosensitive ion channel family protein n=1 Tax=Paludibacter sp. 221 TaxID=2302939 RepID=UPI0013D69BF7|nr:mechanosensitive ion channel family protein [Paludibacter sp. 221]NDV47731.1 mechanosensitive ion channel family protein [Paludibacter sp. 221]
MEKFFERIIYGNSLENWGISILIVIGALILNKIIKLLNKHIFQKAASKTKNRFDDILFQSLEAPVLLGVILVAIWIALVRLNTPDKFHQYTIQAYQILAVLNVTWFFARLLTSLLDETTKQKAESNDKKTKKNIDKKFLPLAKRFLLIIIWGIGGVTALSNAGISVGALLGTLGIGGVAIALAAQDTIKNLLAGVTIFTDQPFQIGDRIRFSGIDGNVEDIGLRSTRIRTLEKRLLTIPNYKIMDAAIENVNTEPMRKVTLNLGLTYDTTPEKMQAAMDILKQMPQKVKFVSPKDMVVAFTDFGSSALGITFIYYVEKKGDVFSTNTSVNMEILNSFNAAGLSFAFPTQSIYLEKKGDEK